jgi:hypothetical protein
VSDTASPDDLIRATWNRRFPGFTILAFGDHTYIVMIGPRNRPPWAEIGCARSWPWVDSLTVAGRDVFGGVNLDEFAGVNVDEGDVQRSRERRKHRLLPDGDIEFAEAWVASALSEQRRVSYAQAAGRVDEVTHEELFAPSGARLCGEVEFFWDGAPEKDVRVFVSVWWLDDPKFMKSPLALDDFILGRDGYVGE